MIPRTFTEKYGESLPKTAFLKTPVGGEWKVNLVKHDGRTWFQKGWKEFVEYHSLAEGHIVVFRYERTSNFQVFIFDMSALEIDYPIKSEGTRASNDKVNKRPVVESLEDHRPSQKRKDNSSLEFLQQFKKKRSRYVEVEGLSKLSNATLNHIGKTCKEGQHTAAKKITTLDRARSFKTCNPSFLVVMGPSYIHSHANLNIPSLFGKTYFDLGIKRGDINLQLENGRVWPGRYLIRENSTGTKVEISAGWKPFAMDNNLKVGDVCIFELIDRTKLTFKVFIIRETDNSNCSTSQGLKSDDSSPKDEYKMSGSGIPGPNFSEKQKPMISTKQISALDRASSFKFYNPYFLVVIHLSHVHSRPKLNLPSKFCKKHFGLGNKRGDINLQLSNGRVWPASYHISKSNARTRFHLSCGWGAFAKENDLKVGDVCIFELIDRTKVTFQIHIFRETGNPICHTSQGRFNVIFLLKQFRLSNQYILLSCADSADETHRSRNQIYCRKEKGNKDRVEETLMRESNQMDT
ncbi:hypothetical protein RIF29_29649 [Crotalaria pallida]|uniref:TF-B3 domain-containing protein n=1 Tax=Crotalaria pallida TaxID=3830 RepID=A0AAN9I0K9_CROPI